MYGRLTEKEEIVERSFALLDKYLTGEISPHELHELEKLVLDDDFLFDAYEGYVSNVSVEAKARITLMRHKIQNKKTTRIISFHGAQWRPWAIAASVVLIATLGFVMANERSSIQNTGTALALETDAVMESLDENSEETTKLLSKDRKEKEKTQ